MYMNSRFVLLASNGNNQYNLATALIVTFIVNNHVDEKKNKDAELWEAEFIKHLKNFEGQNITVSFMSEVSSPSHDYMSHDLTIHALTEIYS